MALLLAADRLMDTMRVVTNLLGNCVATFVVARWEGMLDIGRAKAVLAREPAPAPTEHRAHDAATDHPEQSAPVAVAAFE